MRGAAYLPAFERWSVALAASLAAGVLPQAGASDLTPLSLADAVGREVYLEPQPLLRRARKTSTGLSWGTTPDNRPYRLVHGEGGYEVVSSTGARAPLDPSTVLGVFVRPDGSALIRHRDQLVVAVLKKGRHAAGQKILSTHWTPGPRR